MIIWREDILFTLQSLHVESSPKKTITLSPFIFFTHFYLLVPISSSPCARGGVFKVSSTVSNRFCKHISVDQSFGTEIQSFYSQKCLKKTLQGVFPARSIFHNKKEHFLCCETAEMKTYHREIR